MSTDTDGVFTAGSGETVNFELNNVDGADTPQFNEDEFQVLVARFDPDREDADSLLDEENLTVDRALELLRSDEVAGQAEFDSVSGGDISVGQATAEIELEEPGSYFLIGHVGGTVLEDGADRPEFNDTTVIGVDAVTAQAAASTIELNGGDDVIEPGENVTIDADANLDAENVSHAAVVFDEGTLSEQTTRFNVTEEISTDLRSEDVQVETTLGAIQGTAHVSSNAEVRGTTFPDQQSSGVFLTEDGANAFFDLRNAFIDELGLSDQAGDPAEFVLLENNTLNASMTAIGEQGDSTQFDVETLEEWPTGDYTVVHAATDADTGDISTTRETVTLAEETAEADPDDVEVIDSTVNETDIEPGETVRLSTTVENTGEVSIDVTVELTRDGDVIDSQTETIGPNSAVEFVFEVTLDEEGDYEFGFRISQDSTGDLIDEITVPDTVSVSQPTAPGPGPSPSPSPPPTDPGDDPETETTITERDGGASISTTNIQANTPTRIETGTSVTSGGTTLNAFIIDSVEDIDQLDIEVDASEDPPAGTEAPDVGDTLSYLDIDAGELTDDDYNSVEWEFSVSQDRLEELERDPENVRLNRYDEANDEWEEFETTHVGGEEFTAEAPGFSVFAITAAESADIQLIDAALSTEEAEVDEEFDVTATLENQGDEDGETTLELLIDGDVVETTDVTVPGGDTTDHTFTTALGEEGAYEVAVNDVPAGTIDIAEEVDEEDPEAPEEPEEPEEDDTLFGLLVVIFVFALLAVVGISVFYRENGHQPWESPTDSGTDPLEE